MTSSGPLFASLTLAAFEYPDADTHNASSANNRRKVIGIGLLLTDGIKHL
jgi:hypothetical protein